MSDLPELPPLPLQQYYTADEVREYARAALAAPAQTGCACRWKDGEYVERCELHEAWHVAVHEWAERAKSAEGKLAALPPQPAPEPAAAPQAVPRLTDEQMERNAEAAQREQCAQACRQVLDEAEEARAMQRSREASGTPDELDRLRHWMTVSTYNAGVRRCIAAVLAPSERAE